eukprot:4585920-Prymnesium_polylepis.1
MVLYRLYCFILSSYSRSTADSRSTDSRGLIRAYIQPAGRPRRDDAPGGRRRAAVPPRQELALQVGAQRLGGVRPVPRP